MFTGLVEEVGRVEALEGGQEGARLAIRAPLVREGLAIGDSVSVNGACLTAVALAPEGFSVDCAPETLRRTALGGLAAGDRVNLERALRLGDRLGGHMVQGHVDATGAILTARSEGESVVLEIGAPPEVLRYVVEKGSVAVDGVSLTVAARLPDRFAVALIPHTMAATTLGADAVGRPVNLEADVVAKYVEALVRPLA
ncbi:MAG: riboflavin synthase [Miltoncostaeaceae bacterium]|jgi:riboflavin synthase|nr:riboflavin synthase [Miltoncostaeaceae bacterium]